jgi:hypothetical protein
MILSRNFILDEKKISSKWLETYMILAKNVRGRVRVEENFF